MAGQVEGKVALVTGGASGIGEAVVELFAREGATVIATDIDELRGPELADRITKAGGKAIFLEQDVTSEERWIEIAAEIAKRFGRLDILVSNAGIGIAVPSIVDMTLSDWRKQNAINLDGVFLSALPAPDAQDRRRLDRYDVLACGPARRTRAVGLFGDQGRRPAVRKVDRDG